MTDVERICSLARQGVRDKDTVGAALDWDTARIWQVHDVVKSGSTGLNFVTEQYTLDALRNAALVGRTLSPTEITTLTTQNAGPRMGERVWWLTVLTVRFFTVLYCLGGIGSLIALMFTSQGPSATNAVVTLIIAVPAAVLSWIECRRLKKKYPHGGWIL